MKQANYAVVTTRDEWPLHVNLAVNPFALLRASKARIDAVRQTLEPDAVLDDMEVGVDDELKRPVLANLYYEIDDIEQMLLGCITALSERLPSPFLTVGQS